MLPVGCRSLSRAAVGRAVVGSSVVTEQGSERVALLGAVAYGELSAFTRLAAATASAPDLAGRAELARLAAMEMDHYRLLADHLAARGADVVAAMEPFVDPVDAIERRTAPRDWAEALVSAHLGRGLATDLVLELAASWEDADGEVVRKVAPDVGHDAFAEREVRALCADTRVRDRLAMWGRRLLGESLAAAATALDEYPAAVMLTGDGDRAALFKRLKSAHRTRMHALGL